MTDLGSRATALKLVDSLAYLLESTIELAELSYDPELLQRAEGHKAEADRYREIIGKGKKGSKGWGILSRSIVFLMLLINDEYQTLAMDLLNEPLEEAGG